MNKILKFTVYFLFILFFGNVFVNASDSLVDFNVFINDIVLIANSNKKISIIKFFSDFNKIKDNKCSVKNRDSFIEFSPVCLLDPDKNFNLDINESLDYLLQGLNGFSKYYSENLESFVYEPAEPLYQFSELDRYKQYKFTMFEKIVITYMENKGQTIRMTKEMFSKMLFDRFSFYIVPTYLGNRGNCSATNYRLAISKLNGMELKAGKELNLNSLISYDPRSCKGTLGKNFMFFGGSCGASTQFFRLSLIMPNLDVIERYPHSKWRAYYYGNKIMGDDAAMFENSMKFIVKNNFSSSIYFRVYEQGDFSYLVGILPYKEKNYSEVNKSSNGLSASVYKKNYNIFGTLLNIYQFDSRYSSNYYGKS
ncbi:MAG: VanW family protein [Candidatus Absconditabacterales bacterium]|nr:VanW family protein [Candidatus Absconditabacterales bacterium]